MEVPLPESIQVTVARLNDALRKELDGNTLNTNSNFLEQLLPPENLPFPVDEDLLRKLSASIDATAPIWNDVKSCFHQPPMDFGEVAVCEWLNNIGATMGSVYGRQCRRVWWTGYCGKPLQVDPSILRKPVLILLDRSDCDRIIQKNASGTEWAFVKSLAEVQTPDAVLTDSIASDIPLPVTLPFHHFAFFYQCQERSILNHGHGPCWSNPCQYDRPDGTLSRERPLPLVNFGVPDVWKS
jgi:hypothetical protein